MDKVKLVAAITAVISLVNLVCSGIFGFQLFAEGETSTVVDAISIIILAGYGIYLKFAKDAAVAELAQAKALIAGLISKK